MFIFDKQITRFTFKFLCKKTTKIKKSGMIDNLNAIVHQIIKLMD